MIVLAGHTRWKMDRLRSLIPLNTEFLPIYNGKDPKPDEIHVPETSGRDIAMYAHGIALVKCGRYTLINDDVSRLADEFWSLKATDETPVIGVANLASWIEPEKRTALHIRQGTDPLFIRTSALHITREAFQTLYAKAFGNAQRFEKSTLINGARTIPPQWAVDSNIAPYV